tara:strand:+ start:382 stop:618 length:237 start_codon:yes stop_codon:yes gene_type:complete
LRWAQQERGILRKYKTPRENKNIHFSFMNTATPRQTTSKTNKALSLATLNLTLRKEKVGSLEIINREITETHPMTQSG